MSKKSTSIASAVPEASHLLNAGHPMKRPAGTESVSWYSPKANDQGFLHQGNVLPWSRDGPQPNRRRPYRNGWGARTRTPDPSRQRIHSPRNNNQTARTLDELQALISEKATRAQPVSQPANLCKLTQTKQQNAPIR